MFKRRLWFHRGRIDSDEGFSVAFGRDMVVYRESGRRMAITADVGAQEANIFTISIGRWDDDQVNIISEAEKQRIADNIERALEWQGLTVKLI